MSWREMSPMEERLALIREYESELFTMTELAEQYGISRKTGYKWLARYTSGGAGSVRDRSRRPHVSPQTTDAELIDILLAHRRRHPRWGAKKLLAIAARRQPDLEWPSRATVCTYLKQHGLVAPRRRRRSPAQAPASPLPPITTANQVWTTDFKGEFRTGDGCYCHPLTLRDGFSRFVLRCDGVPAESYPCTRPLFERAFAAFGLPACIRSDNGTPFASTGVAGLSRLSVWWMQLGIRVERIEPGCPEQNGSHEQFHRVLKRDTTRPPASTAASQQRRFDAFRDEYNK